MIDDGKRILCVSWEHSLAETRKMLLSSRGYSVVSVVGMPEAIRVCQNIRSDLLLLGHSVPPPEKRKIVEVYRAHNSGPVISLLNPNQSKLPEVEYGVETHNPKSLLQTVEDIFKSKE